MTFLLEHFVNHHCLSRRQVYNWYIDKDLHSYQGFDGAKQLTAPFIKSLWSGNANKVNVENMSASQTITTNPTTVEQCDNMQIKDESNVS